MLQKIEDWLKKHNAYNEKILNFLSVVQHNIEDVQIVNLQKRLGIEEQCNIIFKGGFFIYFNCLRLEAEVVQFYLDEYAPYILFFDDELSLRICSLILKNYEVMVYGTIEQTIIQLLVDLPQQTKQDLLDVLIHLKELGALIKLGQRSNSIQCDFIDELPDGELNMKILLRLNSKKLDLHITRAKQIIKTLENFQVLQALTGE